jgi:hypothetical protein
MMDFSLMTFSLYLPLIFSGTTRPDSKKPRMPKGPGAMHGTAIDYRKKTALSTKRSPQGNPE